MLSAGGWTEQCDAVAQVPGWAARLQPGFDLFPAAEAALRRYGGLRVRQSGPGQQRARESFEIDPLLALDEEDRFREHAAVAGAPLYPLGEAGNGSVFLAIAPDGRVFALMEALWLMGDTIDQAVEALVLGRASRPVG